MRIDDRTRKGDAASDDLELVVYGGEGGMVVVCINKHGHCLARLSLRSDAPPLVTLADDVTDRRDGGRGQKNTQKNIKR